MRRRREFIAAIVAALVMPGAAGAVGLTTAPIPPEHRTVTFTYKTFLAPARFGTGPFGNLNEAFGDLKLTFNADGIISGTYKPEYGNFKSVSGGRDGRTFWLTFDPHSRLTFRGHFTQRGIVATAQAFSPRGTYWQLHGDFAHA